MSSCLQTNPGKTRSEDPPRPTPSPVPAWTAHRPLKTFSLSRVNKSRLASPPDPLFLTYTCRSPQKHLHLHTPTTLLSLSLQPFVLFTQRHISICFVATSHHIHSATPTSYLPPPINPQSARPTIHHARTPPHPRPSLHPRFHTRQLLQLK